MEEKVSVSKLDDVEQEAVVVIDKIEKEDTPQVEETKAKKGGVAIPGFRIAFPEDEKKYIKILIYGDYGVGKTYLAGTAQDVKGMENVINIDAEGGNKVLSYRGDIPSIQVRSYNELNMIYEYLSAHCAFRDHNDTKMLIKSEALFRGMEEKAIKKPHIWNTVMMDSLTEIARYCMYRALGIDIATTRLDTSLQTPEWTDRNEVNQSIALLIRKFRDLPMHVIFVSSRNEKDNKGQINYSPNFEGKLSNEVQGFMDHVGFYVMEKNEAGEVHRYLNLQPGRFHQAKNRFKNFTGSYLTDPIFQDIYDLEVLNKSIPTREEH